MWKVQTEKLSHTISITSLNVRLWHEEKVCDIQAAALYVDERENLEKIVSTEWIKKHRVTD